MYLTDANDDVARTKNQLAKVRRNEEEPDARFIRGNPEHYIVMGIQDKKIENKKTYYLTKFKGYPNPTWELASMFNRTEKERNTMMKTNQHFYIFCIVYTSLLF